MRLFSTKGERQALFCRVVLKYRTVGLVNRNAGDVLYLVPQKGTEQLVRRISVAKS